ncbi:hypothetical protein DPEC_G00316090 [Dallia pectoralis]|uniref:Uncharacterized protein n=1 Tax=Dallia pectoralis TaxID=75939 RepID=A0ACC2FCG3_DALPE|nr:hypothetical protein DPEC_G00316090 [Dallia pectoralis]
MTYIAKTFYDLKATTLEGNLVDFNSKYPHRLVVLGFPCNQFGYQENCSNGEILNALKYVRPGNGYQPGFTVFEKCDVNGTNTHPVFAYLKDKLPYPDDDPHALIQDPKFLTWSPVSRTDVSWNFEKFLVGPEGESERGEPLSIVLQASWAAAGNRIGSEPFGVMKAQRCSGQTEPSSRVLCRTEH